MKTLILTEKREAGYQVASNLNDPILGEDLQRLQTVSKSKGYLEGENYILSWAAGHLFTQLMPRDIDERYSLFRPFENREDYKMPDLISQMRTKRASQQNKRRQLKILEEVLTKDIKEIIVMTDADEEGEAIGRDMLNKIVKKLPTDNITRAFNNGSFKAKDAVDKSLKHREPIDTDKYVRLYDTQRVRNRLDYKYGMASTKALCDIYGRKLYTGRVKAVVVSLIGDREQEISKFTPKDFFTLIGSKDSVGLKHFYFEESNDDGDVKNIKQERYFDKKAIDGIVRKIEDAGKKGVVSEYKVETTTTKKRPLPLSGTDFAEAMMTKYKISYKECNDILAYLREEGFTTYPATDGRYFARVDEEVVQDSFAAAKKYFALDDAKYDSNAPIFNDKIAVKQNHHPVALTGKVPIDMDITRWEKHKLPNIKEGYELIAKRILVHFLEDDKTEKQSLVIDIDDILFSVAGQKAVVQGWRSFIDKEIKNTLFEFELKEGDEVTLDEFDIKTGATKCPLLYTEATLTKMMMNISRVVNDMINEESDPLRLKELRRDRKLLQDAEGIGTERTRESIINDLVAEELIAATKKGLVLTESGNILYRVLPKKLRDPILTATWERHFNEIRQGTRKADDVLLEADNILMNEIIPQITDNPISEYIVKQKENKKVEEDIKCPLCGGYMIETPKTYKCEHNEFKDGKQSGCKFSIFKDQSKFFGKTIDNKDLSSIFAATKENPYRGGDGCKNGLYIDTDNKYFLRVAFDEQVSKPGELIETPKTYRLGDKFVFKSVRFKNLTKSEAKKILMGEQVLLKRTSKAGAEYKILAKLSASLNGQVDLEMPTKE